MTVSLPPDLEIRLSQEATRLGVPAEEFAVRLLEQLLPAANHRSDALALLQSWIDRGDVKEQKATGDFLIRALDEDRLSDRKLFPPEPEGITW